MDGGGPRWRAWLLHAVRDSTGGPQLARDDVRQRAAMAGVEADHPLLDADLAEFMLTVDPALSFEPRHDRPLLREAMAGALPDSIRMRPTKSSFDAPFQQSLMRELPAIAALLGDRDCRCASTSRRRWSSARSWSALAGSSLSAARRGQLCVWRLVTAELWLNLQDDPFAPRTLVERCGFPGRTLEVIDPSLATA